MSKTTCINRLPGFFFMCVQHYKIGLYEILACQMNLETRKKFQCISYHKLIQNKQLLVTFFSVE